MEKALYFVAVIPYKPLADEITEVKRDISIQYNTVHSLKSPPHITLQMPFRFLEAKEFKIINALKTISEADKNIEIEIKGFGAFPPSVLFLNITENDKLWYLWKKVTDNLRVMAGINNATYRNQGFRPHLTVAFRDLKKSEFTKAWQELKSKPFNRVFQLNNVWLLKHNGKSWDLYKEF